MIADNFVFSKRKRNTSRKQKTQNEDITYQDENITWYSATLGVKNKKNTQTNKQTKIKQ
jgi:hypothetical protein